MTADDVAQALTGIEYPYLSLFSRSKLKDIGADDFVIVFCADHEDIFFRGAITAEQNVNDGAITQLDSEGLLPIYNQIDKDDSDAKDDLRDYFRREAHSKTITVGWDGSWFFRTDIPHATFDMIDECGKLFCRGIVFSIEVLTQTQEPDQDQAQMALCAIRYAIGRQSYVVSDAVRWARDYGRSSRFIRSVIIRDLEEAIQRQDNGFPSLGGELDSKAWRAVLADLKAMSK